MWLLEVLGVTFNAADGTVAVPIWAAGVAVALTLVLFILALVRSGLAGTIVFLAVLGIGGWAAWSWADHERALERRALQARISALDAQAMAPGSVLGCLREHAAGTLDAACEAAVFASGPTAAGAVAFMAARLDLLSESVTFARTRDPVFEPRLIGLRRGLEQDRFGIVSHILASRPNCSVERCEAMRLFADSERLRANLRDDVFGAHLARAGLKLLGSPVAQAPPASPEPTTDYGSGPATKPLPPGYKLPSSDSIPPVSIMTAEPTGAAPVAATPQPARPPAPPPRPARVQRPAQQTPPTTTGEPARGLPTPPRVQ